MLFVPPSPSLARRFRVASVLAGAVVTAAGYVALLGWILENETLKGLWGYGITVKTNTAIALMLVGLGLILLTPLRAHPASKLLGRTFAALATAIGLTTLSQHLTGWDLGIDQILFREGIGAAATHRPNRMGPPASIALPLLGMALLLLDFRTRRGGSPSQWLAILGMTIPLIGLVGYVFGVRDLYGLSLYTGIALHTALSLFVLGAGILVARADTGLMRLLASEGSEGFMLRRMLPAAILLPVALNLLRVQGERLGWYNADFGRTLLVLAYIFAFSAVAWWVAGVVSRHAAARASAEADAGTLRDRLVVILESEREARAAAERSSRIKDEFLATLSHELRTPLNAITGWAGVLLTDGVDASEMRRGLEAIDRNSRLQAKLIDDLLDMSRIVSGKVRLDVRPVNLPSLVQSVMTTSAPAAEAKGVRLQARIEAEASVAGDPERLQQVLSNLLSNAIKFTPRAGSVEVTLRRGEGGYDLAVSDDGIGIDPEFLPRIFERFSQADASTTRRHGGLGLGLAITRHLVELHGGTLHAASAGVGKGATFTVRLPERGAVAAATPPAAPTDGTADEPGSERVSLEGVAALVVDDHADTRDVIERMLVERGAEVRTAASAAQALQRLRGAPFDVLIADISMPEQDGYDLIREIRSRGELLPAIALTALAHVDDEARALAAGYQAHLAKPVGYDRLVAAIARLVRRVPV